MKYTIYILLAGIGLSTFSACHRDDTKTAQAPTAPPYCINDQLKKTTVINEVLMQPIVEQMTLSGKIEYNENDLVAFRSLLEGVVSNVNFELGDYVKKGQTLATMQSVQAQELYQQRRFQQSQIALLEKQLAAKRELLKDGMTAITEVNAIEHELEASKIEWERIDQALRLYRVSGDGSFQIVSPKDGYIIQKAISTGQNINADSDPLFSVSNLKQVWVMVNIYAGNLRYIKEGDAVKVRTIAYPDEIYTGKIDKIYNVFDDNEHVLKARVVLDNQNLSLLPGLAADIIINKKTGKDAAAAIPNKAKVFYNNKEYIVVYKNDCELDVRPITTLAQNEEYTYIKETFESDEKVIVSNALLLFEHINQ